MRGLLPRAVDGQLYVNERAGLVGVGNSGGELARRIKPDAPVIPVQTVAFNRERANRELEAEPWDFYPAFTGSACDATLVDDVAVSGRTLEVAWQARRSATPKPVSVVGLLFNSKTTLKRIGGEVRAAVEYARDGGGNPPINSVSTLLANPERLRELAGRYFGDKAASFTALVREVLA